MVAASFVPISDHCTPDSQLNSATKVSKNPFINVENVSAVRFPSQFQKKEFNPSAKSLPSIVQSNVSAKANPAWSAVFNAPAIVFPIESKSPGVRKTPFKKSASPVPKFSAALYTSFQLMLSNAFLRDSPTYAPNCSRLSMLLLYFSKRLSVRTSDVLPAVLLLPVPVSPLPLPEPPVPVPLPLLDVLSKFDAS